MSASTERLDVNFESEGVTIAGWLYPGIGDRPRPGIVMAPGYAGVRGGLDGYGFPEAFAAAGFTTLLFDNPNLGASGGEPRQELDPLRQQRAYRDAITRLALTDGVDEDRIGIWGTSYSGGHVIVVAATDRRVRAVVAQAPTVSGHANMLRRYSPGDYATLARRFAVDRKRRAAGDPGEVVEAFAVNSESYRWAEERPTAERDGWRNEITLRSLELYDGYEPARMIDRVSPSALLMIVPTDDVLTPAEDALGAYEHAYQPKDLVLVPGGHYAVYGEHFERASSAAIQWFRRHL